MTSQTQSFVHFFPIGTTLVSAVFATMLFRKYFRKRSPHLFWWAFGVACYGSGAGVESLITLFGNTVLLNRLWYVTGALLGGYPLAQGSVYFHFARRTANRMTAVVVPYIGPFARVFGFVALPWPLLAASLAIVAGYILATETAKRRFYRHRRR